MQSNNSLNSFDPKGILPGNDRHFRYIDMAYFIGIILVIWGHSHPLDSSWWGTWYSRLNGFIYTFHMPLYFFIGGYLMVHSKSIDKLGYKKWAVGKLWKFLVPYFVLTALAFVPKAILGDTSDAVELSIGYFLKTTFLIPRIGVWGHFWFIPTFLSLDLMWGAWRFWAKKSVYVYRIGLAIGVAVSFILAVYPIKTDWFVMYDFSQEAIFYALGIVLALIRPFLWDKIWKNILGILCCAVGTVLLYPLGNYMNRTSPVINFAVGLMLVWICWSIALLMSKTSFTLPSKLTKFNFSIYIFSWPAQALLDAVLRRMGVNWLVIITILFVAGFAVPLIIIFIYKKLRFLHCKFFDYLIGISTANEKGAAS